MGFIPVFIATSPQTDGALRPQLGREKKAEDGPRLLVSALRRAGVHLRAPAPTPPNSCVATGTELWTSRPFSFLLRLLEVVEGGRQSRGSRPCHDAAEEACRERRGPGAGLRGLQLRWAALCQDHAPVRSSGSPLVSCGRNVLSVPGGENQRPPGEDRRSRIRQRGPFHLPAS